MKRALLIAVLALTILFAMTATAFAEVSTVNGNFQAWDSGHVGNENGTPHVDYSTTSEKCAVCHSVHNANTAANNSQNILLRSDKADACTYCHMNASITTNRPYAETAANYETDDEFNHSDSSAVLTSYSGCPSCHSVHGAGTYTHASVATSILKLTSGAADPDAAPATDYATSITSFCSQCHAYVTPDYDVLADGEGNHIMTGTFNDYDNPEASASATGSPVANAGSANCTSCHDAVGTGNGDSFPHYMPNNARFLVAADYQGAGSTTATVSEASVDGACIKCHMWNGGPEGVG